MSGLVGVICDDAGRYSLFSQCLTGLRSPVNTTIMYAIGSDRSVGRNNLVRQALDQGAEWLIFLDDDHTFPPSILEKLLAHNVPICGALYVQRQVPFNPIAYSAKDDETGEYAPLYLPDHPHEGLVPVRALGTGGMLIRSEVFWEMPEPWFQHTTEQSEDLRFCDVATEMGIPIYVDMGVRLGHLSPSAVWPTVTENDEWAIGFSLADRFSLTVGITRGDETELGET